LSWIRDAGSRRLFLEGLRSARDGVLLMIIADIVSILAISLALWLLIAWLLPLPRAIPGLRWGVAPPGAAGVSWRPLEELLARAPYIATLGIIVLVLLLAAGALAIVGLWALFVPGARKLGRASAELSTASTLIWIGYFWGVLVLIVALFAGFGCVVCFALLQNFPAIISALVGTGAGALVGAVLAFIGFVGSILLVFKLYELERDSPYLVAVILMITSLVLSFAGLMPYVGSLISIASLVAGFVSLILLYVALGRSIDRAASLTPVAQQASLG
jgi:uncharacterized protein YybS (DUF2232 family)